MRIQTTVLLSTFALLIANTATATAPAAKAAANPVASLPAPYNTADLANGAKQYNKCRSCHTLGKGEANLVGPNLFTLFGRKSGTLAGYTFSPAMKAYNVKWDFATLNTYLVAPQTSVKGTKMGFVGLKVEKDRKDLIAYLRVTTAAKK